jgi:hypothetical protein
MTNDDVVTAEAVVSEPKAEVESTQAADKSDTPSEKESPASETKVAATEHIKKCPSDYIAEMGVILNIRERYADFGTAKFDSVGVSDDVADCNDVLIQARAAAYVTVLHEFIVDRLETTEPSEDYQRCTSFLTFILNKWVELLNDPESVAAANKLFSHTLDQAITETMHRSGTVEEYFAATSHVVTADARLTFAAVKNHLKQGSLKRFITEEAIKADAKEAKLIAETLPTQVME